MTKQESTASNELENCKKAVAAEIENCRKNNEVMSPRLASTQIALAEGYEHQNQVDEAEKQYLAVAEGAAKAEAGNVQFIISPLAFSKLAQFLERRGKLKEAEEWYQKVVNMRVNAHALNIQADALNHYATMLRAQHNYVRAAQLDFHAQSLRASKADLDRKGLDY